MEKEAIIQKVKNVLTQIEPYLKADGGGVSFVRLDDDMTVWVTSIILMSSPFLSSSSSFVSLINLG